MSRSACADTTLWTASSSLPREPTFRRAFRRSGRRSATRTSSAPPEAGVRFWSLRSYSGITATFTAIAVGGGPIYRGRGPPELDWDVLRRLPNCSGAYVLLYCSVMRFVLALMAVMALLASPIFGAAAQAHCNQAAAHAMSMPMDDAIAATMVMGGRPMTAKAADLCCAAAPHRPSNKGEMNCLHACAICSIVSALSTSLPAPMLRQKPVTIPPARMASLQSHTPPRLERPPRSIA